MFCAIGPIKRPQQSDNSYPAAQHQRAVHAVAMDAFVERLVSGGRIGRHLTAEQLHFSHRKFRLPRNQRCHLGELSNGQIRHNASALYEHQQGAVGHCRFCEHRSVSRLCCGVLYRADQNKIKPYKNAPFNRSVLFYVREDYLIASTA